MNVPTSPIASPAQAERLIAEAHALRAEVFRNALYTVTHWLAHPSLHPHHA